jgi:hypothetical protein
MNRFGKLQCKAVPILCNTANLYIFTLHPLYSVCLYF